MTLRMRTAIVVVVCSLTTIDTRFSGQAPPTEEQVLAEHGIAYTNQSIRDALKNPDPTIRGLAAGILSQNKDFGAIPMLRRALQREQIPSLRVHLAAALASLNDEAGSQTLLRTCEIRAEGEIIRLSAATQLLDLGREDCLQDVIGILENQPTPPARDVAMQYLRRVGRVEPDVLPEFRRVIVSELQDPNPMNRQYASECISAYGDAASEIALSAAARREDHQPTKSEMQRNLKRTQARLAVSPQ